MLKAPAPSISFSSTPTNRTRPTISTGPSSLSRKGSLIVVDNVVREGAILAAQSENPHVKGLRGFYARVAQDPRVTATAFQTVGNKGHDGLAIVLVTAEP